MVTKITPEQVNIEAQAIRNAFIDQPDMVLFSRDYMFEIASILESQTREAALGRAAVTVMDAVDGTVTYAPCYKQNEYKGISDICSRCQWFKFCRLRAEFDRLQRKGAE